jgi:hypothetical protein
MKFFIKRWPDDTATLMTESGQVIWTFSSMQEAIQGCTEWVGAGETGPAYTNTDFADRFDNVA